MGGAGKGGQDKPHKVSNEKKMNTLKYFASLFTFVTKNYSLTNMKVVKEAVDMRNPELF